MTAHLIKQPGPIRLHTEVTNDTGTNYTLKLVGGQWRIMLSNPSLDIAIVLG